MTTFDKKEAGEEAKFAFDEEMQFKARARRDRAVGRWAAEKLGLSGAQADAYANGLLSVDLQEPGDDDVIKKLSSDFSAKGIKISAADITRVLGEKMAEAMQQLKAGK